MIVPQTIYYPMYRNKDKFIILVTGGRGSGKSFNVATFIERLTFELYRDPVTRAKIVHNILYCRYTMISAEISIIPEVFEKIEMDGTQRYFKKTSRDIINQMTGSHIMFRGINTSSGNQTAKLKSIHGLSAFVCDEAEEWTSEVDFEKIMYSIRKKGIQNIIFIIMNPTDSNHWVYKRFIERSHRIEYFDGVPVQISTHPNVLHIHTSYLDNLPNLSPEFLREAEECKQNDPDKYAHTFMGRWSDVAEGAVFKTIYETDAMPPWVQKLGIGLDFGYTHDPTAAILCGLYDTNLYQQQLFYERGLKSKDIIARLRDYDLPVYSDSADPRLIDEIALGGVQIYPVDKFPSSVNAGIDYMQGLNLYVTSDSYDLQEEYRKYVWDKDKDGYYINKPIDNWNHGIDAARYYCLGCLLGHVKMPQSADMFNR